MSLYHPTLQGVWKYSDRRLISVKPSENLKQSNDTPKYTTSSTDVKLKEILNGISGYWRVKFNLWTWDASYPASGRIYRNGSGYGTIRITTSTSPVTFTEDLSFYIGDLIQLYANSYAGGTRAYVQNFRLYGDYVDVIAYNTLT